VIAASTTAAERARLGLQNKNIVYPLCTWQVPVNAPNSILSVLAHAGLGNWRIVTNCDESTVGAAAPMCLGVDDVFRVQHLGVTQLLRDPKPVDKRLGVGP
jgi:hypothetical protein